MTWDRAAAAWNAEREAQRETAALLLPWLEGESIAKGDEAVHVAETLAEDAVMRRLASRLDLTGVAPEVLRNAAEAVASTAGIDPADLAWDNYLNGHGGKPEPPELWKTVND